MRQFLTENSALAGIPACCIASSTAAPVDSNALAHPLPSPAEAPAFAKVGDGNGAAGGGFAA
jgi:hypothetical protein